MTTPPPGSTPGSTHVPADVHEHEPADEHEHDNAHGPDPRPVGVGPHPGPWPEDPRLDPELLEHGDRRNVEDRYRYWSRAAIVADLAAHRHPLHVAIENLEHDANIGSIVRTANAFAVGAFHIVGRRRWNRRGAMVTDRYQQEIHHPDVADLVRWARQEQRPLIAIDNVPGAEALETAHLPERAVLVFGQEGPGISPELLAACERTLAITQYGSTRSLNVAAAAAIAMHAWMREHADPARPGRPAPLRRVRENMGRNGHPRARMTDTSREEPQCPSQPRTSTPR